MYKILVFLKTKDNNKWYFYKENDTEYIQNNLADMKDKVLELIDSYGEDYIKIVEQRCGLDQDNIDKYLYGDFTDYNNLLKYLENANVRLDGLTDLGGER